MHCHKIFDLTYIEIEKLNSDTAKGQGDEGGMEYRDMSRLLPGECGIVMRICGKCGMKRRLQDLGLVEGTRVLCLQKSPLGDPTAFSIRGAVIALRAEDASNIEIQ